MACGLAEIPQTGLLLGWLGGNVIVTVLAATCLFALSASRRRERAVAEAGNSWLAPLPAVSPVSLTVICGTTVRLSLVIAFVVLGRIARQWSREQLAELRAMSGEGLEAALAAACAAS